MGMHDYLGMDIPKLGFGLMRLPRVGGRGGPVDIPQLQEMVDLFMQAGFTYFDTAYIYDDSEVSAKAALVDRYPRESYQLANKLPAWHAKTRKESEALFYESLERTGAGYFDYYLLHNIDAMRAETFEAFESWEFLVRLKEEGLIKHLGFSFHDSADLLDEVLTKHPETEFVQLQINYADWESHFIQSRACYEVALKHNKPIIIMEPLKGGSLVNLPANAMAELTTHNINASMASWAMRYVCDLKGIITILSGMSNPEQMRDNLATFRRPRPLSNKERAALGRALFEMEKLSAIPCTLCDYCVSSCPCSIAIPSIFEVMNNLTLYGNKDGCRFDYYWYTKGNKKGLASDCTECAACEAACTQKINIIEELARAAATFES